MATPRAPVDQNQLKQLQRAIKDTVNDNYATTFDTVKKKQTLNNLAIKLFQAGLINAAIADEPDYGGIMGDFTATIPLLTTVGDIEDHCRKFVVALEELGGAAQVRGKSFREEFRIAARGVGFDNFLLEPG